MLAALHRRLANPSREAREGPPSLAREKMDITPPSSSLTSRSRRKPLVRKPAFDPRAVNKSSLFKTQITVAQTCRFLELNDYPMAVREQDRAFLSDEANFSTFFLPLAASVNPGASLLRLKTLAKAKWSGLRTGQGLTTSYYSKPRGNRVRLNV